MTATALSSSQRTLRVLDAKILRVEGAVPYLPDSPFGSGSEARAETYMSCGLSVEGRRDFGVSVNAGCYGQG